MTLFSPKKAKGNQKKNRLATDWKVLTEKWMVSFFIEASQWQFGCYFTNISPDRYFGQISVWLLLYFHPWSSWNQSISAIVSWDQDIRHNNDLIFSRMRATLQPTWFISRSVSRLITFYFFLWFLSVTSLLLPKWSSDLKCGPCPHKCNIGSRVCGLVFHAHSWYHLSLE